MIATALLVLGGAGRPACAEERAAERASLRVTVQDPSGAVIVGAAVQVLADANAPDPIVRTVTGGDGSVAIETLAPGRYALRATFPGFEPAIVPDVRLRAGQLQRTTITLAIASVAEQVDVGRDRRTSETDPRGDALSTTLTEKDIEDLPDDPDEMEAAIQQMAGPGAVMRVNGFRGGGLPPKSQIREIRFRRNTFAAENHESGFMAVDILTKPGMEQWRGGVTVGYRNDALNAKNAMAPRKVDEGQTRGGLTLDGPLWRKHTSLSFATDALTAYDTQTIRAVAPPGEVTGALRRPTDRVNFTARVEHALSKTQVARVEFQRRSTEQNRLGVGNLDLLSRAYSRDSSERMFRVSTNGAVSKKLFNDLRLQVHWQDTDTVPFSTEPTIRVSGAFTTGGANQQGERRQRAMEIADNLDIALGRHAIRTGLLVEGSSLASTFLRNGFGTFTFGDLDAYDARTPSTYTMRQGDPAVAYSMWQFGWYAQDDIRLRRDLTLSLGLRHEWQTHLDDPWNLAPRAGFAWSPFKNGSTTFRGGVGVFYDWYEADTYEQTLQVDGERLTDVVITSPGFPDPWAGGSASVQPPGVIRQADGMSMPRLVMASIGAERAIGQRGRINLAYNVREGGRQLRARATNLPDSQGVRPDPAHGNITMVDSIGHQSVQSVMAGGSIRTEWHRMFVAANYFFTHSRDDGDGPLSLPADSVHPDEWGPGRDDITHRVNVFGNVDVWRALRLGATLRVESAPPYNITTGFDDNGDTIFTDRPSGVSRNSARADGLTDLALRLSYRFGFGPKRQPTAGGAGGPQVVVVRRGGEGDGPGAVPMMGGGPNDRRLAIEFYAQWYNALNSVSYTGYNGVASSPLFGEPSSARPPRRVEVGTRFTF